MNLLFIILRLSLTRMIDKGEMLMETIMDQRSKRMLAVTSGLLSTIKTVIPARLTLHKLQLVQSSMQVQFGVFVGLVGDVKGKLVLKADPAVMHAIGEKMFGTPIKKEMLLSFTAELGNMVAGVLATNLAEGGLYTDITEPTVIKGQTEIFGFRNSLFFPFSFDNIGKLEIILVIENTDL